jgi:hypothetical protein
MAAKVEKVGGVRDSLVFATRLWSTLTVASILTILKEQIAGF